MWPQGGSGRGDLRVTTSGALDEHGHFKISSCCLVLLL